jgi:hypothetical protein
VSALSNLTSLFWAGCIAVLVAASVTVGIERLSAMTAGVSVSVEMILERRETFNTSRTFCSW